MYIATNSIVLTLLVYIALYCKYINYTNYDIHYLTKHKRKPESYFHEAITSNVLTIGLPDYLL